MKLTNNEIKYIKKLKDKKHRKSEGLFLVEGKKLCEEVIKSNYNIKHTITSNQQDYLDFPNLVIVDYDVVKTIGTTDTPQDIICVCEIPTNNNCVPKGNSLVLDALQDPGNIGTLIRSAIAFGFKDVYFIDCPDIYSEKVVRASMGAVFKINAHIISREKFIEDKENICEILLGTAINGLDIGEIRLPKARISVIIGNEGNGISDTMLSACDKALRLPMTDEVESLNAGVAGSIVMFEIFKGEL